MSASQVGIFVYAKDVDRVAAFYTAVLGLSLRHRKADMVVLGSDTLQLIVHATPADIASKISIASPPQKRENAPIKFFCAVPSISAALSIASEFGGEVMPQQWQGPGFIVRNAYDPEGNIFQLRESVR